MTPTPIADFLAYLSSSRRPRRWRRVYHHPDQFDRGLVWVAYGKHLRCVVSRKAAAKHCPLCRKRNPGDHSGLYLV